jgi:hypothetical protein
MQRKKPHSAIAPLVGAMAPQIWDPFWGFSPFLVNFDLKKQVFLNTDFHDVVSRDGGLHD